ncbi:hypothetical protein K3V94_14740, partial [Listeria monocytogenes]|nr:hypothetical protein [Listeria monocytogenes]
TLQKKLESLYKPSGRNPVINQQLKRLKEAQQAFQNAKKQNAQYEELINEKEQASAREAELQIEKTTKRVELDTLETLG